MADVDAARTEPPPRSPPDAAVEFLIRFTRVAHEAGYPTADLEDRVVALARALALEGVQISATPTLVEVSLGVLPHQRTYTLRVRPTPVDVHTSRASHPGRPGRDCPS